MLGLASRYSRSFAHARCESVPEERSALGGVKPLFRVACPALNCTVERGARFPATHLRGSRVMSRDRLACAQNAILLRVILPRCQLEQPVFGKRLLSQFYERKDNKMQCKGSTLVASGAAAVLLSASYACAAPVFSVAPITASMVTATATHCWRSHGVRHCGPRFGYQSRYREYNIPEAYRTGSSRWWEEMDRQGRGGRGRR